ncbi:MAG: hypothetical protein P4L64_13755 [Caulobacteraceae bacterium]|nr:hypothetical protein [Caulobacteraceae bacterium]
MRKRAKALGLTILFVLATAASAPARAAPQLEPKVVLVTFDGVRWQDIFRGADPKLMNDPAYVNPDIKSDVIGPAYLDVADRASALTPFLHGVMAKDGVLLGNRDKGECAKVANDLWFSYPGYNEFQTGRPDPNLTGNGKTPNPNVTFLEYLQTQPRYHGKVSMVGAWDVFPYIVNTQRTDVPVNIGFNGTYPTDVKTAREGMRLLEKHDQRAVYIAFGDTDEFAHAGDYAHYLMALERGDDFLRQVWDYLQSDPYYRGQTTLMVLTDHGRGETPTEAWREHGSSRAYKLTPKDFPQYNETGVVGSDNVWFAAMGPGVKRDVASGPGAGECLHSAQVAASLVTALGEDWRAFSRQSAHDQAAPPFPFIGAPTPPSAP